MRNTGLILAVLAMLVSGGMSQASVMLDMSSGFNYDGIVGPGEDAYAISQGDDIAAVYGGSEHFNLVGQGWAMIAANTDYSGTLPLDGIPADGVVTAASGTIYHTASYLGNATYPGNMTEDADPSSLNFKSNTMLVMSTHNKNSFQLASSSVVLPAAQQQSYVDINFLMASSTQGHESSQMELYVDYADGTSVLVWSGYEDAPKPPDNAGDADLQVAMSFDWIYNGTAGADGAVEGHRGTNSLYEFKTPIALDSNKTLKGFTLLDNNPDKNWFARGAFVMAATATEVPEPASMGLVFIGGLAMLRRR